MTTLPEEIPDLLAGLKASDKKLAEATTEITTQTALLRSTLINAALAIIERDGIPEIVIEDRQGGYSAWPLIYNPPRDSAQSIYDYRGRMFLLSCTRNAFYVAERDADWKRSNSPCSDIIWKLPMDTVEQMEIISQWLESIPTPTPA